MNKIINELPNGEHFKNWLISYLKKLYSYPDKKEIIEITSTSNFEIEKTGEWGDKYGYVKVYLFMKVRLDQISKNNESLKENILRISNKIIKGTDFGLEFEEVRIIPQFTESDISIEEEIDQIVNNHNISQEFEFPYDLMQKAREMSEAYTYIYVIENSSENIYQ